MRSFLPEELGSAAMLTTRLTKILLIRLEITDRNVQERGGWAKKANGI